MNNNETSNLEREAGKKAALKLRKSLRNLIKLGFETTQGNSAILKSTVLSKMDGSKLQRLVIKMPYYGFIHHFGFEGVRSNGVRLKLHRHEGLLNGAITHTNALEDLTTDIATIRLDQVVTKFNF